MAPQGKRIGRVRVSDLQGFARKLAPVLERLGQGGISRRQAAKELGIGYNTVKRLMIACGPAPLTKSLNTKP